MSKRDQIITKEELISAIEEMLHAMYYEDLCFFYGMIARFLKKTGQK